MHVTNEKKQNIYEQIERFNSAPSNPQIENSKPVVEAYLYVERETALDRATFFKWVLKNIVEFKNVQINNIMDIAFGSGSLTSHIVLEADIEYKKLFLNDKIKKNTNQKLKIGTSTKIMDYDFLDYCIFQEKFKDEKIDLFILNPQIGGAYTQGKFEMEDTIDPIIYDKNLLDYLKDEKNIDISKFKKKEFSTHKLVYLRSTSHTKTKIEKLIGKSLFNYNDIAYHPKKSKKTYINKKVSNHKNRNRTNVSKLRNTIDACVNNSHIVIFYGKKKHFDILFADYNVVVHYKSPDKGEDIFIIRKGSDTKTYYCYEKNEKNNYTECAIQANIEDFSNINLKEEVEFINNELSQIKSVEGDELIPFKTFNGVEPKEEKHRKKPFKNFLREEY